MLGKAPKTENKPVIYLNVTNGRLEKYAKREEDRECFSFLSGTLTEIRKVDREFRGEVLPYWYVNFEAEEERYSLGFPFNNNVFKSIIMSLSNKEAVDLSKEVKLSIYTAKGRTKAKLEQGGVSIRWIEEPLPPITEVKVGERVIRDDSKRMAFISSLVDIINLRTKTAI